MILDRSAAGAPTSVAAGLDATVKRSAGDFPKKERGRVEASEEGLRIAEVIGRYDSGGVDNVVMNYCSLIACDEMRIDILYNEDSMAVPPTGHENIRFIQMPAYKHFFSYLRALNNAFRQNDYQAVHAHVNTLSVFPLAVARYRRIPIRIAHSHSMAAKGEAKRNVAKYLLRPFSQVNATHLMACSEQAGRWLFGEKAMASGRVILLHNAVPVEKFAFSPADRQRLRREYGWDDDFVVGHVGRLVTTKNHEFLIRVFAALKKRVPNARLLLVGDGPLRDEIRERAAALNVLEDIRFTGLVANAAPFYQAMDCLVLPSLYEGLGMVAVEAQIAGLPVLSSNAVPPEAYFTAGNKRMSLKESPEKWAETLAGLVRENASRNRHEGAEAAWKSEYNIQTEAHRLSRYYQECVNNGRTEYFGADQRHHPGL